MISKILLDRSIFHKEKFCRLKNSKLATLVKNHSIVVYGNPMLFEETLNLWFRKQITELKEHILYLLEITNGRWFRDRGDLWNIELEGKHSHSEYFFRSPAEQSYIIEQIRIQILAENLDKTIETEAIAKKEESFIKNTNFMGICYKMRLDVSESLKNMGKRRDLTESFDSYFNANVDYFGEDVIRKHVDSVADKELIIGSWKQNKDGHPYFTLWMKAFLYITYHAMKEANKKIDPNSTKDIDYLVYLKDLDGIVSDDHKFMKDAFVALYGKDKQFLSLDQFLDVINK